MSLLEDASLLSFYFISQSSQKIPPWQGIENRKATLSHPTKQTGATIEGEFPPGNPDFGIKGENNPKDQKKISLLEKDII